MKSLSSIMWATSNKFSFSLGKKLLNNVRKKLVIKSNMLTSSYSTSTKPGHTIKEGKVNVDGIDINCVQVGAGEHPVLLLPGVMGTCWTDFKPQIENFPRDKFKIVAWDPPGYGKSRPPDRKFPEDFFQRDAEWGNNLMKTLGHSTFSLLGWSDGGITALILASKFSENVRKMIVVGANAYVLPDELKMYEKIRNIDSWSARMKEPLLAIYGEDYFRKTWAAWIDSITEIYKKNNGDICKNDVARIKCPTLIVHGKKDVMVDFEHPFYLNKHIKNSQTRIFEQGAHNLHLRYPEEFNKLATDFFMEKSKI
ncbi:valacyclovir hydrolase-like [Belonocnema kinseyi]|uniref:valacyclovir hydrolase-like n=1 Tax=Belonocnema kinseyi TaxID=2817044 RepID=UPI00143D0C44|nr:valacyclovir hydrolase-like [Belonocnema kinseyi]